jgi:hypothetical protein
MVTKIFRGALLAAALALIAAPAISQAATAYNSSQTVRVNYDTSIQPLFGFGGPWTGTLQLTFNPDGIISGYYRPADNQNFVTVTGGHNGKDIWLDIGQSGRLHVNGTLQNGTITGSAYDDHFKDQFKFNATTSH